MQKKSFKFFFESHFLFLHWLFIFNFKFDKIIDDKIIKNKSLKLLIILSLIILSLFLFFPDKIIQEHNEISNSTLSSLIFLIMAFFIYFWNYVIKYFINNWLITLLTAYSYFFSLILLEIGKWETSVINKETFGIPPAKWEWHGRPVANAQVRIMPIRWIFG